MTAIQSAMDSYQDLNGKLYLEERLDDQDLESGRKDMEKLGFEYCLISLQEYNYELYVTINKSALEFFEPYLK